MATELKTMLREVLEREKQDLRELRSSLGRVARVMGDVSFQDKASWPAFAERVLGAVLDGQGLHDDVYLFMRERKRRLAAENIPLAMHHFGLSREEDVIFEMGSARAIRGETDAGVPFYALHYEDNVEWDLFLDEQVRQETIFAHLSAKLWAGRKGLRLDMKPTNSYCGEVVVSTLPLGETQYIGELSARIEEWRKFKAAKIRRNVLLQGKPGCGKSTLCLHAASELSARTAVISARVYEQTTNGEWAILTDILAPEMLILDDIDRVGSSTLASKLETFEERRCVIPFVMFTSNDIDQIPEAFRRPGRIDQILEVREPGDRARRDMIERFAQQLGCVVPEHQLERLTQLVVTHSGAHALEAIKRGMVLGWDHADGEDDITFRREDEGVSGADEEE